MSRKVCVLVTARPSYARIKSALRAIDEHPELDLQLVVTASAVLDRYGSTIKYVQSDGFDVAARVNSVLEGENLVTSAKSTGLALVELATVLDNLKPDVVVTVADRPETLATAAAAAHMNFPLVHVQGGELTGSLDEKVRHAITKLANFHFVCTKGAAERVIRMGERSETVFVTGCPSIDLSASILESPGLDFEPFKTYGGVGAEFEISDGYLVVMQHPVTTEYDQARQHIIETLHAVRDLGMPAFWFWPNVDAGSDGTSNGIRTFREVEPVHQIHFFKNMLPEDFLRLIYNSRCVVGNSSVGIRECAFLGVAAVNIGTRQRGRERGPNVVDVGYDRAEISQAILRQLRNGRPPTDPLYGDGTAGKRIARILAEIPLAVEKHFTY